VKQQEDQSTTKQPSWNSYTYEDTAIPMHQNTLVTPTVAPRATNDENQHPNSPSKEHHPNNYIAAVTNGPSTGRKQLFLARASAPGPSEITVRTFEPLTPNSIQCMFNMTGSASNISFMPTLQVIHMRNIFNNEGGTDGRWKVSIVISYSSPHMVNNIM